MPHNRAKREQEVRDRYEVVVTFGEWSVFRERKGDAASPS
jgi:hypothetical protein